LVYGVKDLIRGAKKRGHDLVARVRKNRPSDLAVPTAIFCFGGGSPPPEKFGQRLEAESWGSPEGEMLEELAMRRYPKSEADSSLCTALECGLQAGFFSAQHREAKLDERPA
jgi:hypothetical protein